MLNKYPYENFHELNLDWVLAKLREFDGKLSTLTVEFDDIKNDFDTIKREVDTLLDTMEAEIRRAITDFVPGYVDSQLAPYMQQINDALAEIELLRQQMAGWEAQITTLRNEYTQADDNLKIDYITRIMNLSYEMVQQILRLDNRIDDLEFNLPEIYNLVKGYKTDIASVIYDVYDACRYFAYTALQYTNAGYTAQELDDMLREALDLDLNGYPILYGSERTCINPLTGMRANICDILQDLALFASVRTWTALIFDGLDMDATTIDAKDVTAFDYDYSDAITL